MIRERKVKGRKPVSFYLVSLILLIMLSSLFVNKARAVSEAAVKETVSADKSSKKLVYLVSDSRIPFWSIMARGIKNQTDALGYELEVMSAENSARQELENVVKALKNKVSGIIVSPTTSSACATILRFAKQAGIPVVISDIGTDAGEYISYISSDNKQGAYEIGKVLTRKMHQLKWQQGTVGIIAIPQKRLNGQARTAGFMQALDEAGIKGADLKQQSSFSEHETYTFSKNIIENHADIRAVWLQGSNRYKGALRAIEEAGKKDDILLITFDAEPEFLELIPQGVLVGSAMQQPYLMGEEAVIAMHRSLKGMSVEKNIQLPILAISDDNIKEKLTIIKRNVLGITSRE